MTIPLPPMVRTADTPEPRFYPLTCGCGCAWIMVNLDRRTWLSPRLIHCPHCANAQPWPEFAP